MSDVRLSLAIDAGLFAAPEDAMTLVMRPGPVHQLAQFDQTQTQIEHGFFPAFTKFETQGWQVTPKAAGKFAAAVVFAQRARAHSMDLIARAAEMTNGGPIVVDGQKTDGIEPLIKALKKTGDEVSTAISKAHGKLVVARGDFSSWRQEPTKKSHGFLTDAAVFSPDKIDAGSHLLAAALPNELDGRIADLGAGWGYLATQILSRPGVRECHLVEAEYDALACAQANLADERARFHWADARNHRGLSDLDHVVMNPPFHTARSANPNLGKEMIAAAAGYLHHKGHLWMVANRHLPYEQTLAFHFGEISELAGNPSFKVLRATRPVTKSRRS